MGRPLQVHPRTTPPRRPTRASPILKYEPKAPPKHHPSTTHRLGTLLLSCFSPLRHGPGSSRHVRPCPRRHVAHGSCSYDRALRTPIGHHFSIVVCPGSMRNDLTTVVTVLSPDSNTSRNSALGPMRFSTRSFWLLQLFTSIETTHWP